MWMYMDMEEYKESELIIEPKDTWMGNLVSASSGHVIRQTNLFFFFSPPTEICPELPPVDNSIFVAKEGEGQILGTYLCKNGYHLVGEKTLFCNASKGWNASAPECRCKFDLSATLFTLSSLCILSYRTSSRPW